MSGPLAAPNQSGDQTTFAVAPLQQRQRYEHIAERIAADVRAGRLAPGARLPGERDLARRLGVGRASVREAIAALQNEGVLETRPGSGSFVAADAVERVTRAEHTPSPLPHDASPSDLLQTRLILEPGVARAAAARGGRDAAVEALLVDMDHAPLDRARWNASDRDFHRRLAELTGNPVLIALARHVADLMDQPLWQRLRDESVAEPGRATVHTAEHRLIYEAIVDGDADAAAFHATRHLERVRRHMILDQE